MISPSVNSLLSISLTKTYANTDRGFADDKKKNNSEDLSINSTAEFGDESNIIDFIEYLKNKRDKELN